MSELTELPDGWAVWSAEEDGRCVLAYHPEIFNGDDFPAPCLPTLYLTHGRQTRRPGTNPNDSAVDRDWHVTLYLEPDVYLRETNRFPAREDALECTLELAEEFAAGDIDYRELYQVPRERYFERLDELTGDGR